MLFEWDPKKFSVSVQSMDNDHMKLIELMNKLHQLHESKAGRAEQGATLDALAAFTVRHFQGEEKYMESVKFAGLATHKIIHQNLLAKVTQFVSDFKGGKPLSDEFFTFLKVWLSAHIQGIDRQYSNAGK